jgi:hypothetical protein
MAPTTGAGETAATRFIDIGGTSPAIDGIPDNAPIKESSCAEQKQGMVVTRGSAPRREGLCATPIERRPSNHNVGRFVSVWAALRATTNIA